MGIQFRFTKNKKKDLLRYGVAGFFFFLLATFYWNQSTTSLKPLESGYQGFFLQGEMSNRMLTPEGVAFLKEFLEENTVPTPNPFTIIKQHRAIANLQTEHEFILGLRPVDDSTAFREYGIYQNGQIVYLQVEPVGIDRVLTASFTIEDLEKALSPYIRGEFKTHPTSIDE